MGRSFAAAVQGAPARTTKLKGLHGAQAPTAAATADNEGQGTERRHLAGKRRRDQACLRGFWFLTARFVCGRIRESGSMADIVNLRRARKARDRVEKEGQAQANRARHGRTKAERSHDDLTRTRERRHLDGHQITDDDENKD